MRRRQRLRERRRKRRRRRRRKRWRRRSKRKRTKRKLRGEKTVILLLWFNMRCFMKQNGGPVENLYPSIRLSIHPCCKVRAILLSGEKVEDNLRFLTRPITKTSRFHHFFIMALTALHSLELRTARAAEFFSWAC